MNTEILAYLAGTISSFIFMSSNVPMLWKVFKTKDMHSYSILNLVLVNTGNLLYWLYIVSLPPGPVWLSHTFFTLVSVLMLILYLILHVYKMDFSGRGGDRGLAYNFRLGLNPTRKPVIRQVTSSR